ncbi:MAG: hypothetical protein C4B55_03850 [Candidatus Methanophagaceae archaeon]|nr:MAG: hypothetical protein C4B55_03850 [Methanophagales archaeon]
MAAEKKFVTDRMLGKLTTWLRVLGYDTVYAAEVKAEGKEGEEGEEGKKEKKGEEEDRSLTALAEHEARILLTRDKNLAAAATKKGVQCVQIKTDNAMEQLQELLRHDLTSHLNLEPVPARCSECNARLRLVGSGKEEEAMLKEKNYVPAGRVGVREGEEGGEREGEEGGEREGEGKREFWVCERCGRVYWKGSHWKNMRARLKQLQTAKIKNI